MCNYNMLTIYQIGTLCEPSKLLSVKASRNLFKHYLRRHPDVEVPLMGDTRNGHTSHLKMEKIDKSDRTSDTRTPPANINRCKEETHSNRRIYCPSKDCNHEETEMNEMRTHWSLMHKGTFPEFRDETYFTYSRNKIGNHNGNEKKVHKYTDAFLICRLNL